MFNPTCSFIPERPNFLQRNILFGPLDPQAFAKAESDNAVERPKARRPGSWRIGKDRRRRQVVRLPGRLKVMKGRFGGLEVERGLGIETIESGAKRRHIKALRMQARIIEQLRDPEIVDELEGDREDLAFDMMMAIDDDDEWFNEPFPAIKEPASEPTPPPSAPRPTYPKMTFASFGGTRGEYDGIIFLAGVKKPQKIRWDDDSSKPRAIPGTWYVNRPPRQFFPRDGVVATPPHPSSYRTGEIRSHVAQRTSRASLGCPKR